MARLSAAHPHTSMRSRERLATLIAARNMLRLVCYRPHQNKRAQPVTARRAAWRDSRGRGPAWTHLFGSLKSECEGATRSRSLVKPSVLSGILNKIIADAAAAREDEREAHDERR